MTDQSRILCLTRERAIDKVLQQARIAEISVPKHIWRDKRLMPLWYAIQQLDRCEDAITDQLRDAGEGE